LVEGELFLVEVELFGRAEMFLVVVELFSGGVKWFLVEVELYQTTQPLPETT
jgi:hypothetical protein